MHMTPYPYSLTIDDAEQGYVWIVDWIEQSTQGLLSLENVGEMDGCGLQLLMMAQMRRQQKNRPFQVVSVSDRFEALCRTAGLSIGDSR